MGEATPEPGRSAGSRRRDTAPRYPLRAFSTSDSKRDAWRVLRETPGVRVVDVARLGPGGRRR